MNDIPSSWIGHAKFAQWLVNYMQPKVIVDLGVECGFSTFAFAIPKIGHVYGIDSFEGDDYTGTPSEDQFKYVNDKKEELDMSDYVTFIKGYFDDVAKTWNKKIDILHIDGSHHYKDVKNDYETWSKFINDDGVILFHDTEVEEFDGNIYEVKRFFEELDLPKCNFTHCFGLGIVSKNNQIIETIKKTFNL